MCVAGGRDGGARHLGDGSHQTGFVLGLDLKRPTMCHEAPIISDRDVRELQDSWTDRGSFTIAVKRSRSARNLDSATNSPAPAPTLVTGGGGIATDRMGEGGGERGGSEQSGVVCRGGGTRRG